MVQKSDLSKTKVTWCDGHTKGRFLELVSYPRENLGDVVNHMCSFIVENSNNINILITVNDLHYMLCSTDTVTGHDTETTLTL